MENILLLSDRDMARIFDEAANDNARPLEALRFVNGWKFAAFGVAFVTSLSLTMYVLARALGL